MNQKVSRLIGVNLQEYQLLGYSITSTDVSIGSVEVIRLEGQTLEEALASKQGFNSSLTAGGLATFCQQIRATDRASIPPVFFEQNRGLSRRFIAGGTLLLKGGVKYVLAFSFVGHDWFVRPVVLSAMNTQEYYFLMVKEKKEPA